MERKFRSTTGLIFRFNEVFKGDGELPATKASNRSENSLKPFEQIDSPQYSSGQFHADFLKQAATEQVKSEDFLSIDKNVLCV